MNDREQTSIKQLDAHQKCRSFRENLSALIDGELSAEQQLSHEEHSASCPFCKTLLSQTVRLLETASTLSDRPIPQSVSERLYRRLKQEGFRPASRDKVIPLIKKQ